MHIAIVGNGIAGITAARYIRKMSDHRITVISSETEYFFSRTALMYIFMGHLRFEDTKPYEDWFWNKNRIDLKHGFVETIEPDEKKLTFADGESMVYDKLLLATGSKPNKFGWPGQDLLGVQSLYRFQDLELMEENIMHTRNAVIVGGGLIGIEMAEMLHSRNIPLTFIAREDEYWNNVLPQEESEMISRHIRQHNIGLKLRTELKEILPDENGRARAVVTNLGETIPCQFVGLTTGVHPNIELAKSSGIACNQGILVNEYLQTNIPDIYALGDCAELQYPPQKRKAIEPVWYTGKLQGKTVAHTICKQPLKYNPGIWYNSAKFFDIEYQVYGMVPPKAAEGTKSLFWQHTDGQKSIRIVYEDSPEMSVKGINLMGIRFRHDVCDGWIKEGKNLAYVVAHLDAAAFDAELTRPYTKELVKLYTNEFPGSSIQSVSRKKIKSIIFGTSDS